MTTWDTTVDFVCVGSGGGGMVAAHDHVTSGCTSRSSHEPERWKG